MSVFGHVHLGYETISGVKLKIRFLGVNQRRHSVAIAAVNRLPINPSLLHREDTVPALTGAGIPDN